MEAKIHDFGAQTTLEKVENGKERVVEDAPKTNSICNHDDVEENGEEEEGEASIERLFKDKEVPKWKDQLTIRAFVVSLVLGVLLSFIVMKLNLTTGLVPSFSVSAGLLGFFLVKTWTAFLEKYHSAWSKQPFTRQENTVIQTCVVAAVGIASSGGFGNYLLGMSESIANQTGETINSSNIKNPSLGWIIGFLFLVSFVGIFSVLPLRKIMILKYKLTYPSGTATAHLINNFHTPKGAKLAKKQVRALAKFFSFSFIWSFFQWFYTAGGNCGFRSFPVLGLKAFKNSFYFDFSATYIGVGMICPHIVNISMLVGSIISWGLMWPLIDAKKGDWYRADIDPQSLRGLQGYKVFIGIAMILGDGLYNFLRVFGPAIFNLIRRFRKVSSTRHRFADNPSHISSSISFDDERRTRLFLKDQIPIWLAALGYITLAVVSCITVPQIFSSLKWYHVLVLYIFAPVLAFCNAYGVGLTDFSLYTNYGLLAIFTIGSWAGANNGGVLAGLAACGVMMNVISTASDLMQDFKTGYLTLASPRSMFVSQVIGTAMGCIISPCVFWIFVKAFKGVGEIGSEYPAPYALAFRNVAILGVEGLSQLPQNCLKLCAGFFVAAFLINAVRDLAGKKVARFIPLPMAMAVPFYVGAYIGIDMFIGTLIMFVWGKVDKAKARAYGPAVASGMICGDGIWALPASILALAGLRPPICMKFLSRETNVRVDQFIAS